MKKKIALLLSMVFFVLLLGACAKKDPASVDYNGRSYDELKSDMQNNIYVVQALDSIFKQMGKSADTLSRDEKESLLGQGATEAQIEAASKWTDMVDEFGDYKEKSNENGLTEINKTFKITKSGKTLTTDMTLKFEDKKANFEVVYDYYSMEITGVSIDPIYSMSEKLGKAGMNTLISMTVVFAVLIVISLLIACFKIFPYLEKKKAAKTQNVQKDEDTVSVADTVEESVPTENTELVAVIAAAIAAETGTSTNDFVVRSINRR